jgi:hypothetical protein
MKRNEDSFVLSKFRVFVIKKSLFAKQLQFKGRSMSLDF